jgi:hypothetical protein
MARRKPAAATIAPRKTLLAWIDIDDGDKSENLPPACSVQVQALHAHIFIAVDGRQGPPAEPLQPPPGLGLAPLG